MKTKLLKLEMLRGFAALYVFATHFVPARMIAKESSIGFVFRFGQEAVMLFFLLSGFVVYYSTAKHGDMSFRPYFARRFRRIYPIFLLALMVSFASVSLFGHPNAASPPMTEVLGNIFMLQDFSAGKPGVWVPTLCGNTALWSLSYEWWFYMLFYPLYRFVPARMQIHVAAILSLLGIVTFWLHPNQVSLFLAYFTPWWAGAELGRHYLNRAPFTFTSQYRSIAYLSFLCGLLACPVLLRVVDHQPLAFGIHPILELRHFCACLLFLLIGLLWARFRWAGFQSIFGIFSLVAPISYALYVLHIPLAITSSYLEAIHHPAIELCGYIVISFVAAYLAEVPFQNWINRATVSWTKERRSERD
jgi:peptidoglycan/LPS O-acetylase OafA/YrhL